MNIWSLDKNNTIKHLLLKLQERFGKDSFHLVEHHDTHPLSVRISPPDESMTIYLYCYGQSPGHYGAHLEFPSGADVPQTVNEDIYDELSFHRLVDILSLYL